MTTGHEDDVLAALRQTVEEQIRAANDGENHEPLLIQGASADENLARVVQSHLQLQQEVALLRTVMLKLVSQPIEFEKPEAHR